MLAGLTAGAIAAVIAALVSLPLHSPLDSAFNSGTVTVAALVVGGVSGLLWSRLSDRLLWFLVALAGIFVIALIIAFAGNTQLDRMVTYMVPLAAIVVIVCALLTPLLASFFLKPTIGLLKWSPLVAVIVALAVGFPLMTQGDTESTVLTLDPRPSPAAETPVPTATPITGPASGAASTQASSAGEESESEAEESASVTQEEQADESVAETPVAAAQETTEEPEQAPAETMVASSQQEETKGQAAQSAQFIIGEGSEIIFTVEEELGRAPIRFNAEISSTGLSGTANLDGSPSVVVLDLHSLQSDQEYRDSYIRSRLFPGTPEAVVTVDQLPDLPQSFFDGEVTTGQLDGTLQIGETVAPLVFDVEARHDRTSISIVGRTAFTWDELGLTKPSARSVVYLADEVGVQVKLVAQAAP